MIPYRGWKAIPIGGLITTPGSTRENPTGGWRTYRPVWSEEKCKHCMICFIYCPDSSIQVADGKMTGIDLDFCKGCGICAKECPFGALEMKLDAECKL
ncbi:4Fe-4S binding protein [bacterium]|nr:4Fe-4S binding protein [bacterium]